MNPGFNRRFVSFHFFRRALAASLIALPLAFFARIAVRAQIVSCAAVPGSLVDGPYITANADQVQGINVRNGPNSYLYDKVGILLPYESAPALGRSPGGEWIQIGCPGAPGGVGWVYAANVTLTSSGLLTVVEPPASPTPLSPPTIDPTLAALFPTQSTPTRLPTFTPPAPVTVPVFTDAPRPNTTGGFVAPLAGGLIVLGLLGLLASFFIRR